jgi:hypothetical protein
MKTTSILAGWETHPLRQRPDLKPTQQRRRGAGLEVRAWRRRGLVGTGVICLAIVVGLASRADVNPYTELIVTRNVFGLKDPPPPPPPPDTTPPVPKLTLVGIANVFGIKKAVLKTQPAPGTPPKPGVPGGPPPGQEPPLVIVEGTMQDGVTVQSIDEAAGIVKVDNNGQALTLSFDKDGLKAPSGPAAPAAGQPGFPIQPAIPRPPGMPGAVSVVNPQPGMPAIPAGMTEEMQQRFRQRYGIPAAGVAPVPFPNAVPGALNK